MRHKHYDCIVAWANGEQIQIKRMDNQWVDLSPSFPQWNEHNEYRVKPKKKQIWCRPYRQSSGRVITAESITNVWAETTNWVGPAVLVWEEE